MSARRPVKSDASGDAHDRPTVRPKPPAAQSVDESRIDESHIDESRPSTGPRVRRSILIRLSELFADSEFEKALALAQSIPKESDDHAIVETCERECRRRLEERYLARIGSLQ